MRTRRNQGFAIFDYSAVGTIQHHHLDRMQGGSIAMMYKIVHIARST